ncbi:pyridine nucleotide-disulfide oxidoreductase, dimerization domain protein, partial [Chlamydia psittaci 84-8471/1]
TLIQHLLKFGLRMRY